MDLQKACEILADSDRQHIIRELIENDGYSNIATLAEQISSRSAPSKGSDQTLKHAKINLGHNHLPRLEDQGVIEYDIRSGEIVLIKGEKLNSLLEAYPERVKSLSG